MFEHSFKEFGRIKYIEPANLTNEEGVEYVISDDNISFPYEDYNMAVDLSIRMVNRYSCGWGSQNGLEEKFEYSTTNNSISFLGGAKQQIILKIMF